jgi:hypothetical protein
VFVKDCFWRRRYPTKVASPNGIRARGAVGNRPPRN